MFTCTDCVDPTLSLSSLQFLYSYVQFSVQSAMFTWLLNMNSIRGETSKYNRIEITEVSFSVCAFAPLINLVWQRHLSVNISLSLSASYFYFHFYSFALDSFELLCPCFPFLSLPPFLPSSLLPSHHPTSAISSCLLLLLLPLVFFMHPPPFFILLNHLLLPHPPLYPSSFLPCLSSHLCWLVSPPPPSRLFLSLPLPLNVMVDFRQGW